VKKEKGYKKKKKKKKKRGGMEGEKLPPLVER